MQLKLSTRQIAGAVVVIIFTAFIVQLSMQYVNKLSGGNFIDDDDDDQIVVVIGDEPGSMLLQFQMKDILNSRALKDDADDADFWLTDTNGDIDFLDVYITAHDVAAVSEVTDQYFAPGDITIIHTYSDEDADQGGQGGTNYYDSWFIVEMEDKDNVYWFDYIDPDNPEDETYRFWNIVDVVESAGRYTYRLKSNWQDLAMPTGYAVSITGGNTPYWDIGVLKLWPRASATNMDITASYSGTILDKSTDGAANTAEGADGVGTTPTAITGKTNTIDILISGGTADIGFGYPMLYVKSTGQVASREAFIVAYFNQTTVGHDYLVDHGWNKISYSALYAGLAYYHKIPATLPDKNDKMSIDIDLWLDTTDCTASAGLYTILAFADAQDESSLAIGVYSTANPSFYGMSEWGLDSPLQATGPTVSSGAPTQAWISPAIQNSA